MPPENHNYDFIRNLTPTLNMFNEVKDTKKEHLQSLVLRETCEERKKTLETELYKGINITSQSDFNTLIGLLVKNGILKNSLPLEDMKDQNGKSLFRSRTYKNIMLSLKIAPQSPDKISVYITTPPKFYETDIFPRTGFIDYNGKFEYHPDTSVISYDDKTNSNENIGLVPKEAETCRPQDMVPHTQKTKERHQKETYNAHTIQKGEYLWKIIKDYYGFGNTQEDIRNIGNIIEKLKKDPKNKGKIKDEEGKIFIGDTIYLPKSIQFQYKGGLKKTFESKET